MKQSNRITQWHRTLLSFFVVLSTLFSVAHAGIFDKKPQFLPSSQAFILSADETDNQLVLHWQIAPDYWLYQKEIRLNAQNATLGEWTFPAATTHTDPYFGEQKVYRDELTLRIPLKAVQENASITVGYQGCTEGLCYPPESQEIPLKANGVAPSDTTALTTPTAASNDLTQSLLSGDYAFLWFFLFGLGLAFTPCVLPMLPLLSAIVIGTGERPKTYKAFWLSFMYVQGMALTYTLLGLAVAAIGLPFQQALQSPAVLISLSVLFTLLAGSMFGLFTLQLPSRWQNKLNAVSQKQQGGAAGSVFLMGVIAGLVASPCTSAPLSAALLYVAQTGDMVKGGLTLYLLALGMGVPLMLMTIFGNRILPKSGAWVAGVKTAFGFVMLTLPIFLLSRLIPEVWEYRLWALLGVSFFIWLSLQFSAQSKMVSLKILALAAAMACAQPLQQWLWNTQPQQHSEQSVEVWQQASNLEELQNLLKNNDKPFAMVDFYADWCIACKELDKYTFSDATVQKALQNTLLIRVNVTKDNATNRAMLEHFHILGLPAVLLFNQQTEMENLRLNGYEKASDFLQRLKQRGQ